MQNETNKTKGKDDAIQGQPLQQSIVTIFTKSKCDKSEKKKKKKILVLVAR